MVVRCSTSVALVTLLFAAGCGRSTGDRTQANPEAAINKAATDVQTVRLHFSTFTKSRSGAT